MGDTGTTEASATTNSPVSFDEFKMYFESIERTTDRRLDLNKNNSSTALLVIAGIGALGSWSYDKPQVWPFTTMAVFGISIVAGLFCRWWWRQVVSYKELNSAKFDVLNDMAKRLVFPIAVGTAYRSVDPFTKEWSILLQRQALAKFESRFALGASLSELTVPKSFIAVFGLIALGCAGVAIWDRYDLLLTRALGL